ncbi:MAG TPA: S8 family serine peptidase [Phycisphaerae bacterium]|nr:S8 family serine peptidase [Phycisphaerae bacterium]HRY66590.1 S8 family serine peptidase [Phycisphaerae bacterium]HSA27010.1 S8 family serine peptidase [Phycisphaerae bacterium]
MRRVIGSEWISRRLIGAGQPQSRALKNNRILRCGLTLVLAAFLTAAGSRIASGASIRWRNPAPDGPDATASEVRSNHHVLVRFPFPLSVQQRAEVEGSGLKLLAYLGENSYFAVRLAAQEQAGVSSGISSSADIQPIRREWKLHPRLSTGPPPDWAMIPAATARQERRHQTTAPENEATASDTVLAAYVLFHGDVPLVPEALNACTRHGAVVRAQLPSVNGLVIEMPLGVVSALADEDAVQWIEPALPRMSEVNDSARIVSQVNLVQAAPYGLDGSGINVLLYDAGTAWPDHPDFGGRVFVRDPSGLSSHATHVAGTIAGSGKAGDGRYRGMAPGVVIQSYGFQYDESGVFLYSNPGDIETDYREAILTHGAEMASNSIGSNVARNGFPCELEGSYGVTSAVIDAIVAGSLGTPARVVWAAGNERNGGRCGLAYATIGPPAPAKNPIIVGAVNSNDDSMTWFSGWGPTDDGRLRPDIVAPGCQASDDRGVTSTGLDGGYTTLCGTSMATPAVTGVSALLLQDYKRLYPGTPLPPNAMLKAVLAQTAADLGIVGPDYQTGYGSVRAREAVDLLRTGSLREGSLSQGESKTYLVQVPPGTTSLKATVAWDDPPAAVNTIPALVNDLDVVAIGPAGTDIHYPWTLEPLHPEREAVRSQPDRLNNLEQVVVDSPEPGLWMVRIHGYTVPVGPQSYSLVATPSLVGCSATGTVSLGAQAYRCDRAAVVTVNDCDLNADPAVSDTTTVRIASTSDPAGRDLVLTEVGSDTGAFAGSTALSSTPSPDQLLVLHGDTLTATYHDADAGAGLPAQTAASAAVDCLAPAIADLKIEELTALGAVVSFTTDEPSFARVRFGSACGALDRTAVGAATDRTHRLVLSGLLPATRYEYLVEVTDAAGNLTREDAGGSCMAFATPDAPDYHTRHFLLDTGTLNHKSLLFTPDGSIDYYAVCAQPIVELPVDPTGGAWLRNVSEVTLSDGRQVSLYGSSYGAFYVNSEGTITFDQWDDTSGDTLGRHFAMPRISALFEWFTPAEAGHVSCKQLVDRAAVTWEQVRDAATGGSSTFQAELFCDGRIRLSWLDINANDPLVGLSRGGGIPVDYLESRLDDTGACVTDALRITPAGPLAARGLAGGPFSPACRTYTLTNVSEPPASLPWSTESGASWVSVTPDRGELPPGGSQDVELCIAADADSLPVSVIEYLADVRFLNAITGLVQVRAVQLAVQATSPPTAHDVLAATTLHVPVEIELPVDDDGRPAPPGKLLFRVVSNPDHGRLSTIDDAGRLTYTPDAGFEGVDQFAYQAGDGGVAPGGGDSNLARVTIRVIGPPRPAVHPAPADGASGVPVDEPFLAAEAVDTSRLRGGIVAAAYPADVSDPHFTDVRDKIMATGRFSDIGIINTGRVTPAPADLKAFDAVVVWSNDQFADPFTLGDRLADYVDGGGGVVLAVFANVNVRSFSALAGRFLLDDYFCISYPGHNVFPPILDGPRQSLDRVFLPGHPTMSGVTRFDGGNRSFRIWSSYLVEGASFVANWSDGAPLITVREINGTPRVDLALHPPSDTVEEEFWVSNTDGGLILANALAFAAGRSGCATTYDVYFGADHPPANLICKDVPDPRCPMPPSLGLDTTYYWQIVAHNRAGSVPGPVWSFRTPEHASMTVGDSVMPSDDLAIPFGNAAVGSPRHERITLRNEHASAVLSLTGLSLVPAADVAEDFENPLADDWRPVEPDQWTVQAGALRALSTTSGSRMQATYGRRTWQDASIRLSLWRTGSPFVAAGLALRASENFNWAAGTGSAYLVGLSGMGSFYVARVVGEEFTFLQPWSSFNPQKILTGANDVVVSLVGPDIDVYINGQLAWAGRDPTITGPGQIALLAYSDPPGTQDATHYFDSVQVGLPLPLAAARQVTLGGLLPLASHETGTDTLVPRPELPAVVNPSSAAAFSMEVEFTMPDPCAGFRLPEPPSIPAQLAPGESIDLGVAFLPAWQGEQACDVLLTGNDLDQPRQRVHMTGSGGPAYLQIAPADEWTFQGPEGGPFTPACGQYTLTNTGPDAVQWSVAASAAWLSALPPGGSLEPGQSTSVDLCVTDGANQLEPDDYQVAIAVADAATALSEYRVIHLSVCRLPQAPLQPDPPDSATGVSLAPSLAWNTGLSPDQTCHAVGSARISYQDREVVLADVVAVASDQLLHEIAVQLSFTGAADLHYLIGESSSREGPFRLAWQRAVPTEGQGEAYYSSGTLDYRLAAGRFYAVGVAWGDTLVGYGLDYRAYPIAWNAGTIEGLVSGRFATPLAEMPADVFAGAAAPIKLCLDDAGSVSHDVYLWRDGEPPALVAPDVVGSTCPPIAPLVQGTLYRWRAVAVSACGARESATWSFTTASCDNGLPTIDRTPGRHPVSRKVHGSAGEFDIDLLATSSGQTLAIEPRRDGPTLLIVHLTRPVQAVGTPVTSSVVLTGPGAAQARITDLAVEGQTASITCEGLSTGAVQLAFPGIRDASDPACGVLDVLDFGVLAGDVNGDARVNVLDLTLVRNRQSQSLDSASCRGDVNADGAIDLLDLAGVRTHVGALFSALPPQ